MRFREGVLEFLLHGCTFFRNQIEEHASNPLESNVNGDRPRKSPVGPRTALQKDDRSVFGTLDLTFKKHKVAVFVDGEFFHGKDWKVAKFAVKSRRDFWWQKIEGNIERDSQ